jgi:ribosome maturation protein Sdo1
MTLEENRKLKRKLKKAGYIIKDGYQSPDEWVAAIKVPAEYKRLDIYDFDRDSMTIVDCSYENMDRMKYRKMLIGKWDDIWDYRRMEDFDLEEVLKAVGDIELMYKNLLIEQKLQKIKDMCGDD